jgi:hypothetical protein
MDNADAARPATRMPPNVRCLDDSLGLATLMRQCCGGCGRISPTRSTHVWAAQ